MEEVLFPPIDPYDERMVQVGQRQSLYVEQCGIPDGQPVLVIHGGPGSGCTPGMRRYFDPAKFRVVLFDQRGCGRSSPNASEQGVDLSVNTTTYLIEDIEQIREDLGIDRWMVYGHSWGSVLGLAYAVQFPERVSLAVLAGVAIGDPAEITWLYHDIEAIRPEAFARFREGLPEHAREGDLIDAYADALFDLDPEVRTRAARAFCEWDWTSASAGEPPPMSGRWLDPQFQLARARIATHYFRHDCWLDHRSLLEGAKQLGHIPAVLVNGEFDLQTPTRSAERLAQHWPGARLLIVSGAGHSTDEFGMAKAIVQELDRLGDCAKA